MKMPRLRPLLVATAFALPALAHAHPGHDGDHDFGWDFEHLANHPVATVACVTLLVAAGWGVWQLLKSKPSAKRERVRRD